MTWPFAEECINSTDWVLACEIYWKCVRVIWRVSAESSTRWKINSILAEEVLSLRCLSILYTCLKPYPADFSLGFKVILKSFCSVDKNILEEPEGKMKRIQKIISKKKLTKNVILNIFWNKETFFIFDANFTIF